MASIIIKQLSSDCLPVLKKTINVKMKVVNNYFILPEKCHEIVLLPTARYVESTKMD